MPKQTPIWRGFMLAKIADNSRDYFPAILLEEKE